MTRRQEKPCTKPEAHGYSAQTLVICSESDHWARYGTCEANARKGTGTGICDRPLDELGQCDRASDHL